MECWGNRGHVREVREHHRLIRVLKRLLFMQEMLLPQGHVVGLPLLARRIWLLLLLSPLLLLLLLLLLLSPLLLLLLVLLLQKMVLFPLLLRLWILILHINLE